MFSPTRSSPRGTDLAAVSSSSAEARGAHSSRRVFSPTLSSFPSLLPQKDFEAQEMDQTPPSCCALPGCFPATGVARKALDTWPHTQTQPLQPTSARLQEDKVHLLNLFNNGQRTNTRDFFCLRLQLKPEGYGHRQKKKSCKRNWHLKIEINRNLRNVLTECSSYSFILQK